MHYKFVSDNFKTIHMEKLFLYNESNVRTQIDEKGEFWFAGIDVCNILEYKNASDIIEKKLDDDERKLEYLTDSSGQKRKGWTINESGLYSLILSSSKTEAKSFKRWVTHDILPALRKAGVYSSDVLNRKNTVIQELIRCIEAKDADITKSKIVTKSLEKEKTRLEYELRQVLKSDPNQMEIYSSEVWEHLKIQDLDKKIDD